MNAAFKLVGFLVAAAAVFALAAVFGRVVGPTGDDANATPGAHVEDSSGSEPEGPGDDEERDDASPAREELPGGLTVSRDGYTLELTKGTSAAGADRPVTFTITGPGGAPVTEYDVEHEKELHLIAVRRDYRGFQHVHPTMDETGLWSTQLDLLPGSWRVYADFRATGAEALTLGADLEVPGDYQPTAATTESRTASVGEYEVTLDGEFVAGKDAKLTLSVARAGGPVTDLQPYLGAYGHLVALRGGDMAYLHVHPDGDAADSTTEPGPEVVFYAAVPGPGTYHLYLDFKHEGVVRTAGFTVTVGEDAGGSAGGSADASEEPEDSQGHSGH